MTPDRKRFELNVEKAMINIRPMTEEETKDKRIQIQAEQIASLKRHILRLETLGLEADNGSPLTPHGEAIAAGDGTLHGAIDYWQQQAFTMAAGQCCVRDGGLMADDHGHQFCDMERQRDELRVLLNAAKVAEKSCENCDQHLGDKIKDLEQKFTNAMNELARAETALSEAIGHANAMSNMIRGFILKRVERETLDDVAAAYRKWEENNQHVYHKGKGEKL